MIYLKQSTASQEVLLGPFVDSTDGNTAETGLTIANTDIKIHKAGATTLANKNSGGATHISGGNYYAVLDAADTDTLGSGCIVVQVAGALAVRVDFVVLAANVYDSIIGGGDLLDVNTSQFGNAAGTFASGRPEVNLSHISGAAVSASTAQLGVNVVNFGGSAGTFASGIPAVNAAQISGDATAADNLETAFDDTAGPVPWQGVVDQGTAQSATSTTVVLRAAAAFADSTLVGATIAVLGSTQGYWQTREILSNVGSTDTVTVDAWTVTPSGTITYKILAGSPASASVLPAVNVTHAAGTAWGSGAITAASIASDALTAAKFASDVTTELQSGLATSSALATVAGYIDTEVAAIKAVTDKLDTALELDSAVYRFTVNALENAPAGGGGGTSDWTTDERDQIRHRLGIDGSATAPSATPSLATASALSTVAGYVDTEVAAVLAAVDTEVAAIKAKTDNLPAAPAATGDIPTAAAIADAVHDEVVDGTTTFRQSTRLANAVLGGKLSGGGTGTEVVRDLADSKARITYTVDDSGNRTAVTRDLT